MTYLSFIIGFIIGFMTHFWWSHRSKKLNPLEMKKQREFRKKLDEIHDRQRRFVADRERRRKTKQDKRSTN